MKNTNKFLNTLTKTQKQILNLSNLNYKNNYLMYLKGACEKYYKNCANENKKEFYKNEINYLLEFIKNNNNQINLISDMNMKKLDALKKEIDAYSTFCLSININNIICNYFLTA